MSKDYIWYTKVYQKLDLCIEKNASYNMIFRVAIALFRQLSQRLKSYETKLQYKQQAKILVIQFLIK